MIDFIVSDRFIIFSKSNQMIAQNVKYIYPMGVYYNKLLNAHKK